MEAHRINSDVTVLGDTAAIPGIGHLPVNAFVLHSEQPVVVDTGLSTPDKDFVTELLRSRSARRRWIWISNLTATTSTGCRTRSRPRPGRTGDHVHRRCDQVDAVEGPLTPRRPRHPGEPLDVGDPIQTGHRPPRSIIPRRSGSRPRRAGIFSPHPLRPAAHHRCRRRGPGTLAPSMGTIVVLPSRRGPPSTARGCHLISSPSMYGANARPSGIDGRQFFSSHQGPALRLNEPLFDTLLEAPDVPDVRRSRPGQRTNRYRPASNPCELRPRAA